MKHFTKKRKERKREVPAKPNIPEITQNPKEIPVKKQEEPFVLPPDFEPDKDHPEIFPIKK